MPIPPNTSMVLNQEELEFIAKHFSGSKSAAIHAGLLRMMREYGEMPRRYYTAKQSAKGAWIVWFNGINQVGRFDTEAEAQAEADYREAHMIAQQIDREQRSGNQQEFNATVPSLNEMQIRWQRWRNWFYGEMTYQARKTQQFQRAHDMKSIQGYSGHSMEKQANDLTDAMSEDEAAAKLYESVVGLDKKIKQARYNMDQPELEKWLAMTPDYIDKMKSFWPFSVDRPD